MGQQFTIETTRSCKVYEYDHTLSLDTGERLDGNRKLGRNTVDDPRRTGRWRPRSVLLGYGAIIVVPWSILWFVLSS
ncbi:hypothetical protein ASE67_08285 [Sphingomonas sp. Leaf23]|uniref:hypothetical protein n=1 Tax=Sphingomonas sp. Leaf23 TaxID=1735689 RepID=UPI0006F251A0|nr:hypothetical protein [Sphingomonas sp. Leaf23]KQM87670.1 hypothetical protein ASE67_08285 [Sphingomonas sp. Leaf23]